MSLSDSSPPLADTSTDDARVSVVVPSYNHARFVERALRSIFAQTLQPAELFVIDDGSTDSSPRIIERVLRDCPFPCELRVRANRGLCATLNEGLALGSRGEFFAYLGSDDLWLPDFLSARIQMLDARPRAVLGYGHAYIIDGEDRVVDATSDWATYADGDARAMLRSTIAPMSPTVLYRREALGRHGWRESARLEDYDLYLRLAAEGEFAFDPRVLAAWRRHEENASRNQRMMLEEHLAAQQRVLPAQGISAGELARLQTRIKFNRAEDFLRIGEKREALRLMRRNLGGATSMRTLGRMLLRLLVPYRLVRWRAQRRAAERYGEQQIRSLKSEG